MDTKALRVFYRKSDNRIVWTHELRGPGEFPITIEDDITEIPSKMPDGVSPLGGVPEDYACIEERDTQKAVDFLVSDENSIVDDQIIIGPARVISPPGPPLSTHLARLDAIIPQAVKPATVTRTWEGCNYVSDCFVTESVKDQYLAGDIKVGDYVLVHYDDIWEMIVIAKVFKSW